MRRSWRIWALLIAVMSLLAAACDGAAEEPTTTEAETPTTTEAPAETTTTTEPPAPATLAVGMGNLPPSGVPWTGAGSPGQYVWGQVFDALTYIDADGSVVPALAESWTSVDETTWEFTLREGVTFQNGDPFNADAVVGTFDILLSEEGRSTYSANVNNYAFVTSVTAVDDTTVQITTETPQVLTPNALSIAYIVPPEYFAEQGAEGFATAPVGTGPYTASTFSDQEVVLEAWDGSWRGVPAVGTVEFLNLNDPAARLQALQSGQIQIAQSVSPDQIEALEAEGFEMFTGTRGSAMSLALINVDDGPMASQEVRQALNYAIDRQTIVDSLLAGLVAPGQWPVPGVNGESQDPYPYDPDLARELLTTAGFPDGFDFLAEITVGAFPADADIYEAMQGYLADVGVNVELRQIDFAGEWLPKFSGTDGADWEGAAFGLSWNAAPLMDAIRPFNFFSCGWTNEFFCDEDAEALITQINATFDVDERDALLADLLAMTRENPSAIWLVETAELWAHSPAVDNFGVFNFNIPFEDVSLSE